MNLWLDEAYSFFMSQQSISYIATNLDFHPPLYYLLLKFWIALFGESIIAMRSLSIIIALLVIAVSIELFRLFSKDKANIRFFLINLILNTAFLYHATQIRQYILGLFFVLLAVLLFLKGNKYFFIPMTLAVYTHYFTIFAFVPFIIYFRKYWKQFVFSIVLFLPYAFVAVMQIKKRLSSTDWYGFVTVNTIFANYYNYVAQVEFFNSGFIIGLVLFLTLAYFSINIIEFWNKAIKQYSNKAIKYYIMLYYLLIPLAYLAFCSLTRNVFHPRYFFFLSVFFIVPVYSTKLKIKYLFVLFTIISLIITVNYFQEQDYELRDISEYIIENQEAEVILAESPMALLPVMYYTREQNLTYVLIPHQDITVYGGYLIEYLEEKGDLEIIKNKELKKINKKKYYLQSESCLAEGKSVLQLKGISLILSD